MSRTIRKDVFGNKFSESQKRKDANARYHCHCSYCTGVDRNELIEKIAEKELKTEIKFCESN